MFIMATALFALAYAQSPLYTSNQNQYFLHGLARAGQGFLQLDWLANTVDPTPIFSILVAFTARILKLEILFYFYYALLMGIYLFSLVRIARVVSLKSPIEMKPPWSPTLVAALICVHSAALRFLLSRTLGVNWSYILEDGVADQRILGPVLQPSTFGVFLVASICLFSTNKPYLAVLVGAFAAAVHPTYLLSAGTLTLIYILITLFHEKNPRQAFLMGIIALIVVAPVLQYSYVNFVGISPQNASGARDILVGYRIPHHAIISQWFDTTAVIKILVVLTALYLMRHSRKLFFTLLGSTLIAGILTAVQGLTGSSFLALLFPWRLSIYIVPISTTIILVMLLSKLSSFKFLQVESWSKRITILGWVFTLLAVAVGVIRFSLDLQRVEAAPERKIESYIFAHKSAGDVYLTPIKMQDFRLKTGAPVYVDFKSIPYQDQDVLEWYRRIRLADEIYINEDCSLFENVHADNVTHLVVERDSFLNHCPTMNLLYQDDHYSLFRVE